MSVEIFYFSSTGNSLVIAREIARNIGGKLTAIPSAMKEERIPTNADVVGIVFPVYYATNDCGIPLIVARFINKLQNLSTKYVFAVCTHGGMPGSTIGNLRKAIENRGGKLACGFEIKMGNKNISAKKQRAQRAIMEGKVQAICSYVACRGEGRFEKRGLACKIVLAPLRALEKPIFMHRYRNLAGNAKITHLPFSALVPLADNSYRVSEKCSGCGICARVCPVGNIELVEGKPVWRHNCETCYRCYTWCPNKAIYGDIVSYNQYYHNPEVQLRDILMQSQL